jgi:hypothetical protein
LPTTYRGHRVDRWAYAELVLDKLLDYAESYDTWVASQGNQDVFCDLPEAR